MRTPSPPGGSGMLSPPSSKPLGASSTPGSFQVSLLLHTNPIKDKCDKNNVHFQALTKIRKSLRDKKSSSTASLGTGRQTPPLQPGLPLSGGSATPAGSGNQIIVNLKEDLQAVKDEAAASKEVIAVLRKTIEELQKEKETL